MKKLSQERIEDIKGRFLRGQPLVDAAFELGLSMSTVSKYYEAARREQGPAPHPTPHRFSNRRAVRDNLEKQSGIQRSTTTTRDDERERGGVR